MIDPIRRRWTTFPAPAAVLAVAVLIAAATAFADEPTGFDDLPWGTARAVFAAQCPRSQVPGDLHGPRDIRDCWIRAVHVGGSACGASFMFQPRGVLSGYSVRVDAVDYHALRDVASRAFGSGHETLTFHGAPGGGVVESVVTQ